MTSPDLLNPAGNSASDIAEQYIQQVVQATIEQLETKYGVLAQHFFARVASGSLATDLAIYEFIEYMAKPLQKEIESWREW